MLTHLWALPNGDPSGNRTRVSSVRGWRLSRLTKGPYGDPKENRTPVFAVKGRRLSRLTMGPNYLFFIQITRVFHRIIPADNLSQLIRLNLSVKIIKHILYLSSFILHIYYNIFFVKNQERFFSEKRGLQLIRICLLPSTTRNLGGHLTGSVTAAPHSLFFGFLLWWG